MAEQAPLPKENFFTKLKNRVAEIKNDAVASWESMDSKDAVKTYLTGGGLSLLGIVITALGRKADLWPIEGLGYIYTGVGVGAMFRGYIKLMELGIKERAADTKAKFDKGGQGK